MPESLAWLGLYVFNVGGEIMFRIVDIVAYNPYSLSMRDDRLNILRTHTVVATSLILGAAMRLNTIFDDLPSK